MNVPLLCVCVLGRESIATLKKNSIFIFDSRHFCVLTTQKQKLRHGVRNSCFFWFRCPPTWKSRQRERKVQSCLRPTSLPRPPRRRPATFPRAPASARSCCPRAGPGPRPRLSRARRLAPVPPTRAALGDPASGGHTAFTVPPSGAKCLQLAASPRAPGDLLLAPVSRNMGTSLTALRYFSLSPDEPSSGRRFHLFPLASSVPGTRESLFNVHSWS